MQEENALRQPGGFYRYVRDCLAADKQLVVATVIARTGSAPRETGASMAVTAAGKTAGTIGGGILEAAVLKMAPAAFRGRTAACRTFSLTDNEVAAGGMLCGGRLEILVEYLDGAQPALRAVFDRVLAEAAKGRPCHLVRSIRPAGPDGAVATGLGLITGTEILAGTLPLTGLELESLRQGAQAKPVLVETGAGRCFIQPLAVPETVFLCGAGHIGLALATICNLTGFGTVVIDDRAEFARAGRFPHAAEIIVRDSFREPFAGLTVDSSSYIVIATRGHAFDRQVLAAALRTAAGYIGMIASRRKRDLIFAELLTAGFPRAGLAAVHSPIGLDIGARTPAEIAVSIAAELIAVRAGRQTKREGANDADSQ